MKISAVKYTVLMWLSTFIILIFVLVPFHAILTVWLSSNFGHYTALRLWKEVLLAICVAGVFFLLITDHKVRSHTLSRRLVWVILAYMVLNVIWGVLAINQHDVTAKAVGYGLILNLRFLVFFLVTWAVALRTSRLRKNWQKFVLWPAVIVVGFALIQEFFLTPRFLEHFGYSMYTILPFQYVDNNPDLLRVQSTLRGANPLGAYLVLIICVIIEQLINKRVTRHKRLYSVFAIASVVALYFTYSRSAWVGLIISLVAIVSLAARKEIKKLSLLAVGISLIIFGFLFVGFWQTSYFQTTVLHTSKDSKPHVTSNGARSQAIRSGIEDIKHQPLGDGPGSAGPASVHNDKPARIAENYFVQIGQEVGVAGLALFLLINAGVGYLLWLRREDPLALSLFASLIGLTFINLLSHAWTDDTLAYVWWGMAGIAMVADQRLKREDKA